MLQCFVELMPEVRAALKASKELLASQNLVLEMIVSGFRWTSPFAPWRR